jgi:hypothetical protein
MAGSLDVPPALSMAARRVGAASITRHLAVDDSADRPGERRAGKRIWATWWTSAEAWGIVEA